MNWQRVYDEFVADRRAKSGGKELHHIVPRSQGGADDAENLVLLSWSDHLVATVLQAKIWGPQLCIAVSRMAGLQVKVRKLPLTRQDLNWLRHGQRMQLAASSFSDSDLQRRLGSAGAASTNAKRKALVDQMRLLETRLKRSKADRPASLRASGWHLKTAVIEAYVTELSEQKARKLFTR